jgi:hypothetical protein
MKRLPLVARAIRSVPRLRILLVTTAVLLGAQESLARSGDLFLHWNDCESGRGVQSMASACAGNGSSEERTFVASFVAPGGLRTFCGLTTYLTVETADVQLTDWWRMAPGQCRAGAFQVAAPADRGLSSCADPFIGAATMSLSVHRTESRRLVIISDLILDPTVELRPGEVYYASAFVVRAIKSSGAGSCSGCTAAAAISLTEIELYKLELPAPPPTVLRASAPAAMICWQSSAGTCGPAPPRNVTWGGLKSLYR